MPASGFLRGVAPIAAVLAIAGTAGSGHSAPPRDFAVGAGRTVEGSLHFSISAHDNPNGPNGSGSIKFAGLEGNPNSAFTLKGPVTCLKVTGEHATVGIRIESATGAAEPFVGNGFFFFVEDGGARAEDLYANSGFTNQVQADTCTLTSAAVFPVEQGNVLVHDAN